MKIETLIQEPVYSRILETCIEIANRRGYTSAVPTPIISAFWNTTFTPSSSEIIFRHIKEEKFPSTALFSCQPCIRVTDLPRLYDGWHLLFFHMISFIKFGISSLEDEVIALLEMVSAIVNCKPSDLFYTVSTTPFLPDMEKSIELGANLLLRSGIPVDHIIYCNGSANFQDTTLKTSEKIKVSMVGPKIEVYINYPNNSLREICTFEIAIARMGLKIQKNLFAFVIGLERLGGATDQKLLLNTMPVHKQIIQNLCKNVLHPSMASTSIGYESIAQAVAIADALAFISSQMSGIGDLRNRGLQNHYRRMAKELLRIVSDIGISFNFFLEELTNELGIDIDILQFIDKKEIEKYLEKDFEYR